MSPAATNILVIKLGALGDFVQALGPFAAIRRHHPDARIILLTTSPYQALAEASGYFDDIWIDERPGFWQVHRWLNLKRRFAEGGFGRVYDLQTSDRTGFYFRLFSRAKPEWSGIAPGCSHPHLNPGRDHMHTIERQREQLAAAGIRDVALPDLGWAVGDIAPFGLDRPFVLLAPGGSAHRPAKRWPVAGYAALANSLAGRGYQPVLVGTGEEAQRNAAIATASAAAVNLTGRTSLLDLACLARDAAGAVGNDNGPMHLVAAADCPALVLFSAASDPELCAPRGASVAILRRDNLAELEIAEVEAAIRLR
ncbi:MAG: glycosyltransferase family 9 protein [Alphaproteobacteria bacterium]